MADEIIQPIPDNLKGEIEDIYYRTRSERERFNKLNTAEQQKATIEHYPYCFRCANEDFRKEQENQWERHGRRIADKVENVKIPSFDFKKYLGEKRFKKVKESPVIESKLIDGLRQPFQTGTWFDYRCTDRGCGVSVEMPNPKK